jgi:O-antigen ligase
MWAEAAERVGRGGAAPVGVAAALLAAAVLAVTAPSLFWVALAAAVLAGVALLVLRHPAACCALWLLLLGSTPEMWLGEMLGDGPGRLDNWALIIAAEKLAGFALVLLCVFRFGPRMDAFNPGFAFAAIAGAGFAHGLHPRLEPAESLRSLLGSASLYAFSFSRLSRGWAAAIVLVCRALPLAIVVAGVALDAAGLRPLFVADESGLRLQATTHPAFLGGMALTALYAGLVELYRRGRAAELALMGVNGAILVLSGARAPLLIGAVVIAAALLLVPSARVPARARVALLLAGGVALPALAAVASALSGIRLFNLLSGDAANLSNRDLIWPLFADAWEASPVWGWGLGAGKIILPDTSELAKLLGTTAAHNEYLRIGAEGGDVGLALLLVTFAAWVGAHTARLASGERAIIRLVFLGFAAHCYTDNVLIATSSSVFFAWVSAVFARGALERSPPPREEAG